MKLFYFFFFLLVSSSAFSQKSNINFDEIKNEVQDSGSKYFYERLVFRFRYDPTVLDSLEMKHLYYGKFYTNYKGDPLSKEKSNFVKNFKQNNPTENIKIANDLLYKDPTDLEVLAIMLQVFTNQNEDSEEFGFRAMQLRRLIETILKSGSSEEQNLAFTVMSVPDEYVLAGFLKINLQNYKRDSKMTKDATFDRWKDGKKYLIFKVMHDAQPVE